MLTKPSGIDRAPVAAPGPEPGLGESAVWVGNTEAVSCACMPFSSVLQTSWPVLQSALTLGRTFDRPVCVSMFLPFLMVYSVSIFLFLI